LRSHQNTSRACPVIKNNENELENLIWKPAERLLAITAGSTSRRQKRGKILRLLLNWKKLTSDQIAKHLEIPLRQLNEILNELIADGIIAKSKNRYLVA
jgi:DNA-binding HxlR family transcriptional regulator